METLKTNTLTLKKQVCQILERHVGVGNPIKSREICAHLNLNDDRQIRLIIRELIAEGVPIVSKTESPAGYFIAQSWQELMNYAHTERSRIIENALRIRDLKRCFGNYWSGNKQTRLI